MKNRIIVAGSRDITNYNLIKYYLDKTLSELSKDEVQIVSGCCRGVDTLAIQYAEENGYSLKRFPADWDKYGKAAGPIRNEEMAKYASHLITFWDGKSTGTADMIKQGKQHNLEIRIIRC